MEIMFFDNGNTAIFKDNKQQTELQVPWIVLYLEYLASKDIDPAKCKIILPDGRDAEPFRTDDDTWNWRIK